VALYELRLDQAFQVEQHMKRIVGLLEPVAQRTKSSSTPNTNIAAIPKGILEMWARQSW
jgi:hypothetical protein